MVGYAQIDDLFPENTELFVGITMVKKNGEFVVKSQFAKIQGEYTAKKTGTKKDKDIKKSDGISSLKDMTLSKEEW